MGCLEGKVAIILGASDERSMGAATAKRFVEEGAKVVLAARRADRVQVVADAVGGTAMGCDITKEAEIETLANKAVETYGGLHAAVNFAGIAPQESILDSNAETLRESSDVHFVGSVLFMKHMAKAMKGGGSIITTSTLTALVSAPGLAAYAGAKAGADSAMKIAAGELGPMGIRVNSIAPGFTKSAMTADYFEMEGVKNAFLKEMPLGRFPTVEDIAELAVFLSSDAAFLTGQVIDVTAGQSLRRAPYGHEMG